MAAGRCRVAAALILAVLAVLAAGCGGGASTIGTGSTPASSPPLAITAMTPQPTDAPIASASPIPTPAGRTAPPASPPPFGAEVVLAGSAVPGVVGSWELDGRGSDAPWLPFDRLPVVEVSATAQLRVRFVDAVPIGASATAMAAADDDRAGAQPRGVAVLVATDGGWAEVGPLPDGRWVVAVRLPRADGRGDALVFWAAVVR